MQASEEHQPQLVESGIAIRCDTFGEKTSSARSLVVKRKTANPFAKRTPVVDEGTIPVENDPSSATFTRSSILPVQRRRVPLQTGSSPRKTVLPNDHGILDAPFQEKVVEAGPSSERRTDKKWRLLWRGALDVGQEGYRLDGKLDVRCPVSGRGSTEC
jgi:hypothetical protein